MSDLTSRLRSDLTAALRGRDRDSARVLRTVLSAIANAEAQPVRCEAITGPHPSGRIAGALHGLAAGEVPRRHLDEHDIRAVVEAERDERLDSADDLQARGALDAAQALREEAALVERYLA